MDEPWPEIELVGPGVDRYVALQSLAGDLMIVRELLVDLLARPSVDTGGANDPAAVGLWNAAVVFYGRCFSSGRRKGYVAEVEIQSDDIEGHRWMLRHRREDVAHIGRDSTLPRGKVRLVLRPRATPVVASISSSYGMTAHPDREQIESILAIADRIRMLLHDASLAAHERVTAWLARIPTDELYAIAASGRPLLVPDEATESRAALGRFGA